MDQVDLLVISALQMEFVAARAAASLPGPGGLGIGRWRDRGRNGATPYLLGEYVRRDGARLSVALARPTSMGGRTTSQMTATLTERLKPTCLAMCGVCAGNPSSVALGDVVVAEAVYQYDEGRRGRQGFEGDHRQFLIDSRWLRAAQDFSPVHLPSFGAASDDEARIWFLERLWSGQEPRDHPARPRYFPSGTWPDRIAAIESDGLITRRGSAWALTRRGRSLIERTMYDDVDGPRRLPYAVVVGPMASGNAVVKDGITWDQLKAMGVRTVMGLEMEAATVATIAQQSQVPHWLVAKGVMDHADPKKDDRYKQFAARASAEVLFSLLTQLLLENERPARSASTSASDSPEIEAAQPQIGSMRSSAGGRSTTAERRMRRTRVPRQLPPDNAVFSGRSDELSALTAFVNRADAGSTVAIAAIDGTAGIGKTTLAVHWAHDIADRFPDGQLFVNLRGFGPAGIAMEAAEAVRGFLDAFGVPADDMPASLEAQAALYRSLIAHRRILVLLDNAASAEQVAPLLPGSGASLVVVTSRHRLTSLITSFGAHPLTLDVFSTPEASELLVKCVGSERVGADPESVDAIIRSCANLPLALSIVADRARSAPTFPMSSIAAELRMAGEDEGLSSFDGGDPATNVREVFSWSYHRLGLSAARLFRLLGTHRGPDVSRPAAASLAGISERTAHSALIELARAHLIDERLPGRFSSHDLLAVYAGELSVRLSADERQAATRRLLDHYLHSAHAAALQMYPLVAPIAPDAATPEAVTLSFENYRAAWEWFEAEHQVLVALIRAVPDVHLSTHIWQLAWALQDYFRRGGHWYDWAATQEAALAAALGERSRRGQAFSRHGLGRAQTWLGQYEQAYINLDTAVQLFRELGDEAGQAHVHADLGQLFSHQDRPADAIPHAEMSLRLARAAGDRRAEAKALNNSGWYHAQLGDAREGLQRCLQALVLFDELDDHRGQMNTLDSIGFAYHHIGEYQSAVAHYERALVLRRELGDRHGEATTLVHVGDAYEAMDRVDEAVHVWRAALDVFDALNHSDAEQLRNKIARSQLT